MKVSIKFLAILLAVILALSLISLKQCSSFKKLTIIAETAISDKVKAEADYLRLVKAKTRTDTVYQKGKTRVVHKTQFKTITDTLFVENGKVYGTYRDSINSPDLKLQATITASDLKAIDYTYEVTQKIIREQTILTEHDTLVQIVRKGMLLGLADIGLHSYSAGLQYQSRKRLGFTARYNWYQSDGFVSVGVAYRIF